MESQSTSVLVVGGGTVGLASVELKLAHILGRVTLHGPVEPEAFVKAFGIGHQGGSLIRPDGYVAWRSAGFWPHSAHELEDAVDRVSFAESSQAKRATVRAGDEPTPSNQTLGSPVR